jgi:hypothetical protein
MLYATRVIMPADDILGGAAYFDESESFNGHNMKFAKKTLCHVFTDTRRKKYYTPYHINYLEIVRNYFEITEFI